MHHYHHIMYISHGLSDEREGLKQALSIARNNKAHLSVLAFIPKIPGDLEDYKEAFAESIKTNMINVLQETKNELRIGDNDLNVMVDLVMDDAPAIKIIKTVLQKGCDLVVKEATLRDGKAGFKAIDMDLLRKCPVPVWLCRPIESSRQEIQVAVAVDPESSDVQAQRLSQRMLKLSDFLAQECNQHLHIISCWDYALESELKKNVFLRLPKEEVDEKVSRAETAHSKAIMSLIEEANLQGDYQLHHKRGKPETIIPKFVKTQGIDILVMGTVARTGLAGFFIGNTAENIIQQLACTVMAMKPYGFISPVRA